MAALIVYAGRASDGGMLGALVAVILIMLFAVLFFAAQIGNPLSRFGCKERLRNAAASAP